MPPFYYGTHYSTMGAVLHWMVRVVSHLQRLVACLLLVDNVAAL